MENNKAFRGFRFKLYYCLAKGFQSIRNRYYRMRGYDISKSAQMERGLNLDRINPQGIHIGPDTIVTSHVTILSHVLLGNKNSVGSVRFGAEKVSTFIGKGCIIGTGSIIMGGVKIGDFSVIGAGAVVTKDIPDHSIAVGNPARIIRENVVFNNLRI